MTVEEFIENVEAIIGDVKNVSLACSNAYDVPGKCVSFCEIWSICLKGELPVNKKVR